MIELYRPGLAVFLSQANCRCFNCQEVAPNENKRSLDKLEAALEHSFSIDDYLELRRRFPENDSPLWMVMGIFQSQSAYVALRKLLVENSLVAVISLPAGVFNPYSGVKTSIFILDKSLAKQSNSVGFFKIENDGFGLGAQRREIDKNDLPQAKAEIEIYLNALRNHQSTDDLDLTTGQIVAKEKLAANGDYNLSGERYREGAISSVSFPLVSLGEGSLFRVESGGTPKSEVGEYWNGGIWWATLVDLPATDFISQIIATKRTISDQGLKDSSAKMIPTNSVIVSTRATIGRIGINRVPIATNQGFKNVIIQDSEKAVAEYVALALTKLVPTMQAWATGGTFAEISKSKFCELQIPLPPLNVQKEIVAEIEGYQKVIAGAQAVLDNYHPHIPFDSNWPSQELGQVCRLGRGFAFKSEDYVSDGILSFRVSNIGKDRLPNLDNSVYLPKEFLKSYNEYELHEGDFVIVMVGATTGKIGYITADVLPALLNQNMWRFFPDESILDKKFLYFAMDQLPLFRQGGARDYLKQSDFSKNLIPLPPLANQHAIVAEIEAEQALVAANRELILRFERKIQTTLARVWGEDGAVPSDNVIAQP